MITTLVVAALTDLKVFEMEGGLRRIRIRHRAPIEADRNNERLESPREETPVFRSFARLTRFMKALRFNPQRHFLKGTQS